MAKRRGTGTSGPKGHPGAERVHAEEHVLALLNALIEVDIDAVLAYEQALQGVTHARLRSTLEAFRDDHQRHVNELGAVVRRLGGQAPPPRADAQGFFFEAFTPIRAAAGDEASLLATRANEVLTNQRYHDALRSNVLPEDLIDLVRRNFADEQRHLAWVEEQIAALVGV